MKRTLRLLFSISFILLIIFMATSCGGKNDSSACKHVNIRITAGKDPTCQKKGLSEGKTCLDCGAVLQVQQTLKKASHSYKLISSTPSCFNDGLATYECKVCGDEKNEILPAGTHDLEFSNTISAASCQMGGTEMHKCKNCNYTEIVNVAALGHLLDEGTIEEGFLVKSCTRLGCDYEERMEIGSDTDNDSDSSTDSESNTDSSTDSDSSTESETTQKDFLIPQIYVDKQNDEYVFDSVLEVLEAKFGITIALTDEFGNEIHKLSDVNLQKGSNLISLSLDKAQVESLERDENEKVYINIVVKENAEILNQKVVGIDVSVPKMLIVLGDSSQSSQIDGENGIDLESSGYLINRCEPSEFPNTLEALLYYDKLVLMNVDFDELPEKASENIKYFVEEAGKNLLVTAGENHVGENGEIEEYPIGELLPVDTNFIEEEKAVAVILVVDLSSSMKELVPNSPLICKYCLYEDADGEFPALCPQCYSTAKFVTPTRYQVALSSVKKVIMGEIAPEDENSDDVEINGGTTDGEKKKPLQDYDYIGVIAFNQGYYVALDGEILGDKENREVLCKKIQKEFDHFYYAHYKTVNFDEDGNIVKDENGDIVRDTEIKVSYSDTLTKLSSMSTVTDKDGVTYEWYKVKYTRPEKDTNGEYTGNLLNYESMFLLEVGGMSEYARGGVDKATEEMIKSFGTAYKPAIQEASSMMTKISTKAKIYFKQIIFMSDGAPNDKGSGYEGIVERLATSGTRTTAIGIGLESYDTRAIEELNIISTAGKGDIFLVDAAKDLDETLFEITAEISKEIVNEKIDAEIIRDSLNSIVHEGLKIDNYDIIHGYYATTLKPYASRIFYVDALRPLYAEWDYGMGKVCALMTDLGNKDWTGSLFDDTDGIENSRLVFNIFISDMYIFDKVEFDFEPDIIEKDTTTNPEIKDPYAPIDNPKILYVSSEFALDSGKVDTTKHTTLSAVLNAGGYTFDVYHSSQIKSAPATGYDLYI